MEKPSWETIETELTKGGYPFHELDTEDCFWKRHIQKVAKYVDYILILFHVPSLSVIKDSSSTTDMTRTKNVRRGSSALHFSQVSIFIGHNFLILLIRETSTTR